MKKVFLFLTIFLLFIAVLPINAQEKVDPVRHNSGIVENLENTIKYSNESIGSDNEEKSNGVDIYFFYGNGCPHCAKEEKFLDRLEYENKNIATHRYEVWYNRDNAQLMSEVGKKLNLNVAGVPLTVIGDQAISGYYNDEVTGGKILSLIDKYNNEGCVDTVGPVIRGEKNDCPHDCDASDEECLHNCGCSADTIDSQGMLDKINVPILGEIDIKKFSLPAFTLIIAAIDGFNPCSMWVLLFLITLLLGMENKKRMWFLGLSFIIASGVVYFLFLSAWLNLFLFLGFVFWVRIIIGLVAIGSGSYHLYDFWKNRNGGCHVVPEEKRKKVFGRLKEIVSIKNIWLAFGGIVLLAFAVNLVELVCSAGLPAVYTQVLALSDLPTWQHYGYLILYIFIFMLDDLIIFFIAMTTLQIKASSSKYTRWAGFIGGIIIFIIGVLLLFKPGWIMFG